MKYVLLAGVAVLFLATGAAHATDLPDEMLGPWCGRYSYNFPDKPGDHWWHLIDGRRIDDVDICANRGGIYVRKNGYDYDRFGPQASCEFISVEFRRHGKPEDRLIPVDEGPYEKMTTDASPSDVFMIRATCKDDCRPSPSPYHTPCGGPPRIWTESFEIQTANDWLKIEEVNEG